MRTTWVKEGVSYSCLSSYGENEPVLLYGRITARRITRQRVAAGELARWTGSSAARVRDRQRHLKSNLKAGVVVDSRARIAVGCTCGWACIAWFAANPSRC